MKFKAYRLGILQFFLNYSSKSNTSHLDKHDYRGMGMLMTHN